MSLVIVVHKDPKEAAFIEHLLEGEYKTKYIPSGDNGFWHKIIEEPFEAVILNLDNEKDYNDFVKIRSLYPQGAILITGSSEKTNVSLVIKAIKEGAYDFIEKPYRSERFLIALRNAANCRSLKNEIDYLRHEQDIIYNFDDIIAESTPMKKLIETMKKFARVDATILITGETGTGKSFLSGAVHFNSIRRDKPFVKVNCANIPEQLLESELFGHEKGAFTGAVKNRVGRLEQGRGGTVFLDEIGEMSPPLQAKILRFLEEKRFEKLGSNKTIEVDVRIIAATNKNLESMITNGQFREDLYYRLNVLHLHVPPLRERKECIPRLAHYFLARKNRLLKKKIEGFEPKAMDKLIVYQWPGNIRQLSNVIERAVILEEGSLIKISSIFLPELTPSTRTGKISDISLWSRGSPEEKDLILKALEKHQWVQKKAAEELHISPRMLNYKIRKYGITHPSWHIHKH